MMILLKLIFTTLIVNAIIVVLDKYNVITKIQIHAPNKFIHNWSKCQFCVFHLFAVPVCVPVAWYFGFEWIDLFLPLCSASLKNIMS